MAANATRVRFAENVEAGWRFDVSDSLDDWISLSIVSSTAFVVKSLITSHSCLVCQTYIFLGLIVT
jgi:hypothetical protein